jgi:hypothetical protein
MAHIVEGLHAYCVENSIEYITELTGAVRIDPQLSDRWLRFAHNRVERTHTHGPARTKAGGREDF